MSTESINRQIPVLDQWPIKPIGKIRNVSIAEFGNDTYFVKLPKKHSFTLQLKELGIVYQNTTLLLFSRAVVSTECKWYRDVYIGGTHFTFLEDGEDEIKEPKDQTLKQDLVNFLRAYVKKLNHNVTASQ